VVMRKFISKPWLGLETHQVRQTLVLQTLRQPQTMAAYIQEIEADAALSSSFFSVLKQTLESTLEEDPYTTARNKHWLGHTLAPIVQFPSLTGVLMYGAAHNEGPYSILNHFETLQRQGSSWQGALITAVEKVKLIKED